MVGGLAQGVGAGGRDGTARRREPPTGVVEVEGAETCDPSHVNLVLCLDK